MRDAPDAVAHALEQLAQGHARDGRKQYYAVRDLQFNPERDRLRRDDGRIAYTPELAAMLIYLNRTGFNGLFRVNAQGAFNVPAGRYERPNIANREQLTRVAAALADPHVRLVWGSFETVLDIAGRGDFIYFDPPYAPLSRTANFTSYTARRFDGDDQARLQQTVIALARRGCHVVVSNSTADEIAALYERSSEARAAGLRTTRVPARRSINRSPLGRGHVDEFLISNVQRP